MGRISVIVMTMGRVTFKTLFWWVMERSDADGMTMERGRRESERWNGNFMMIEKNIKSDTDSWSPSTPWKEIHVWPSLQGSLNAKKRYHIQLQYQQYVAYSWRWFKEGLFLLTTSLDVLGILNIKQVIIIMCVYNNDCKLMSDSWDSWEGRWMS